MNKEKDRNIFSLDTMQETQNEAFNGQYTFAENFDAHHPKKKSFNLWFPPRESLHLQK